MAASRAFKWATALTKKESPYATQILDANLLDWFPVTEVDQVKTDIGFRTDEEEINGFLGATEVQVESRMGSLTRKFNASVEVITGFLAWALGNVTTTGAADPFTHTIKFPSVCVLNPPSFSLIEGFPCAGDTNTQTLFKGCCVDQITIEITGKGAVKMTVTVKTDGSETVKASFNFPATANTQKKLIGSNTVFQVGPAGGAYTNYSSVFRSGKITINCGLIVPPNISGGIFVPEMQYGERQPSIDVEATIKADRAHALYLNYLNNDLLKLSLALDPGVSPARSVALTMANGFLESADPGREGNELRLNLKFRELHNSTDSGPATFVCKTAAAAYLVAGS
ncbi:MAG: phage tail tube protein [Acidobacteriota bacterium]